ncbi:MAG: endonuclease MutS2 [Dehalobacter sp. 4CP]|uniref:endonuclease MutS2 n=1 Tax=Dehalobacter sp. CP TaxID=2594474 RepID=UPI0013CCD29C|nr:endonuclease MutS2 [Dehalobacter sp. 4CP]
MIASDKVLAKLDFGAVRERLRNHCMLPGAKELAEALVPELDLRTVRALLRETDEGKILLRMNPLFSVRGAREIRPYLERCDRGGTLNPEELLEIRDTLKTARRLKNTLLEGSQAGKDPYSELDTLRETVDGIVPQKEIEDDISRSVSEDGDINDRASEELARLRKAKGTSQQRIKESLDGILRNPNYQKMLQDNVITSRGDRYVVPIKMEYSSAFPGIVHDQSASGATLFIEPMAVVQLGNELREITLKENREVQRILQQLTASVAARIPEILLLNEALIKLDFILAKARLSEDMEAGSPLVMNKQEVKLIGARHPLLTGPVVPISVELGIDDQFLIITGPNTGGKTVTLKTIGLMAVMMQSGLHIPVESDSRLGIFTRIFVDIGDEQSVEQSLSTFSAHMTNIVDITREADSRSLVLLDELGAGTDPGEGAALAMAILAELLERGSCGVATTHYGALKTFAYNTPGVENASVEFNPETLKPTYRLLTGIPGRSNALSIAQRLGLGSGILEKARSFISERDMKESDLLENLEDTQREIELKKRSVEEEQKKAEHKAAELKKKNLELEEKYEDILRKAKEEAVEVVRQARLEAEGIIKEIKEAQKKERREQEAALEKTRQGLKKLSEKVYETGYAERNKSGPKPGQVEPGQTVYMPNLRQKGQVLQKPDNNNEVLVQTGILKVSVPLSEIRLVDETRKPEHFEKTIKGTFGLSKAVNLRSEIDLRGKLVEEGILMLDKYLDDAVITGINQVSVIHGKGTGALRAGIHQFLKRHPHVAAYRLGEFGEGDSGVTIVELK